MADQQRGIFLVTSEAETVQTVRASLKGDGGLETAGVCSRVSELGACLTRTPTGLVVVDIDPNPEEALHDLAPIIGRFKKSQFVVVSSQLNQNLVLDAMRMGARDFVIKDQIESQLSSVLERLTPVNGAAIDDAKPTGHAITVLSASGGCGATTLAVNLANELKAAGGRPNLLVDLDDAYGGVATYLNLRGEYGIADVLAHDGRIDGELINTTVQPYKDHLHALISPVNVNFDYPRELEWDRLETVLDVCKAAYPWTVIDAPRVPLKIAAALGKASKLVLIVCQLTVKDIQVARSMTLALMNLGVPSPDIRYVANRCRDRKPLITLKEAKRALENCPVTTVRNDFRHAGESFNLGRPLAQYAPRSPLRRDIQSLAEWMTEQAAKNGRGGINGNVQNHND